jgi:hypothetical protein
MVTVKTLIDNKALPVVQTGEPPMNCVMTGKILTRTPSLGQNPITLVQWVIASEISVSTKLTPEVVELLVLYKSTHTTTLLMHYGCETIFHLNLSNTKQQPSAGSILLPV